MSANVSSYKVVERLLFGVADKLYSDVQYIGDLDSRHLGVDHLTCDLTLTQADD